MNQKYPTFLLWAYLLIHCFTTADYYFRFFICQHTGQTDLFLKLLSGGYPYAFVLSVALVSTLKSKYPGAPLWSGLALLSIIAILTITSAFNPNSCEGLYPVLGITRHPEILLMSLPYRFLLLGGLPLTCVTVFSLTIVFWNIYHDKYANEGD